MTNIILANIPEAAGHTMLQLVRIAMKAHGANPSPVDIKLELAELRVDQLMQIEEDLVRSLGQFKEVQADGDILTTNDQSHEK
jgi:hypothetical protein